MNKLMLVVVFIAILVPTAFTLVTYQVFFGGFTNLHNYSKVPGYVLDGTHLYNGDTLALQVANEYGPDTYGGFITLVQLYSANGSLVYEWNATQLGSLPSAAISNEYPLHPAHSDGFALVVPLGQNATVILRTPFEVSPGKYFVRVYDVDGQWSSNGVKFQIAVSYSG